MFYLRFYTPLLFLFSIFMKDEYKNTETATNKDFITSLNLIKVAVSSH